MKFKSKYFKILFISIFAFAISLINPTQINKNRNDNFVIKVIDGDTIELQNKKRIRYIGIDTPEINFGKSPDCFAYNAKNENKKLVQNMNIQIIKDVSEKDKYGRLLRYVYVKNEASSSAIFVNEYLVRNGFALVSTYPPDVKHAELFLSAQKEAQENKRGLWKECM